MIFDHVEGGRERSGRTSGSSAGVANPSDLSVSGNSFSLRRRRERCGRSLRLTKSDAERRKFEEEETTATKILQTAEYCGGTSVNTRSLIF